METYEERKAKRTERYNKEKGLKQPLCSACSGSGSYDAKGSPPCGECDGTGKERYRSEKQT